MRRSARTTLPKPQSPPAQRKERLVTLAVLILLTLAACKPERINLPTPTTVPTNNTRIPSLPDLTISGFGVSPQGCRAWNGVEISVGVENIGSADAASFEVVVNGQASSFDRLPAGSKVVASARRDGPPGGITGIADATDLVVESDETNNRVGVTFTPPPRCITTETPTPTHTATSSLTTTPTPSATPATDAEKD